MSAIYSSLKPFLFLLLYSSLMLTVPQYVECQDLYPDEVLDFLGICQNPLSLPNILRKLPSLRFFSDLCATPYSYHEHQSESFLSQFPVSELLLSVALRC